VRLHHRVGAVRAATGALICTVLALALVSCDVAGSAKARHGSTSPGRTQHARAGDHGVVPGGFLQIPSVGERLQRQIPADSGQVVAVYGAGRTSVLSLVELFQRQHGVWHRTHTWTAYNGRKGWTPHHHEGDKRSPVGVFTLSDAGGVLPDPGARLPYTASASFQAPHYWPKSHWHDFDYVIAIDYNRVKGTTPLDPTRPEGQARGGSIWLHADHGSGTSGCVSLSKQAMEYLLRTLDPRLHPVIVMGDRVSLQS
jgi:L,D-peptidoglycan transpeptidase YkuD (ErfK/YbiS/YcfS/YnhG family)